MAWRVYNSTGREVFRKPCRLSFISEQVAAGSPTRIVISIPSTSMYSLIHVRIVHTSECLVFSQLLDTRLRFLASSSSYVKLSYLSHARSSPIICASFSRTGNLLATGQATLLQGCGILTLRLLLIPLPAMLCVEWEVME